MSKKNLKRSLALSALMAFVITGSAMAAELVDKDYTSASGTNVNKTVATGHANGNIVGILDGIVKVDTCNFEGNALSATKSGTNAYGGVIFTSGDFEVADSSFINNSVTAKGKAYGGAIAHQQGKLNISNSVFENNSAKTYGAGIYASDSEVTITGSTFKKHNSAGNGVIYLTGNSALTLGDGNVFEENSNAVVNVQKGTSLTLDGKNVFKNNDNNSILARGEVTFADGSHTILSGGSTQGIAGYDTSVFTIEKGSVVDALDGVYVLGTVDNSGQLTLGAGEYDYSVINTLDGTDGTIIVDADLLDGGKVEIKNDISQNTVVKAQNIDLSSGSREVLSNLAEKLKNTLHGDVDNLTFAASAKNSAIYGDVELDEDGVLWTSIDTDRFIVSGSVRADGNIISLKDVLAFDGNGKFNSLNETAAGMEANKQAIADTKADIEEYRANTEKEVNSKFEKVDQAIADNADAIGKNQTAIGNLQDAVGKNQTAIGQLQDADAALRADINANADAIGKNQTAIGNLQDAVGKNQTAIGQLQDADAALRADINANADAIGKNQAAINELRDADGKLQESINANADAIGKNQAAIGQLQDANGANQAAIGELRDADGKLQEGINANADAIGKNQAAIGELKDADGKLQEGINANADAIGKNQTAIGENADAIGRNQTAIGELNDEVGRLNNRLDKVDAKIDKVGAMAAAMASLKTMGYDPEAPTEIAVGVGQYRNETGLAIGAFHYPNKNFMLNFSLSTAGDEVMGGVGATWKIGRKKPAGETMEDKVAKAEAMKKAAKAARVKAQQARHAKMLAEKSK